MSQNFQKHLENFECANCDAKVVGNGFTDHCPKCLYSKHVDINPGDRANPCLGVLKPIDVAPHKDGYKIFYKCLKCGMRLTNKSTDNDDTSQFISNIKPNDRWVD